MIDTREIIMVNGEKNKKMIFKYYITIWIKKYKLGYIFVFGFLNHSGSRSHRHFSNLSSWGWRSVSMFILLMVKIKSMNKISIEFLTKKSKWLKRISSAWPQGIILFMLKLRTSTINLLNPYLKFNLYNILWTLLF